MNQSLKIEKTTTINCKKHQENRKYPESLNTENFAPQLYEKDRPNYKKFTHKMTRPFRESPNKLMNTMANFETDTMITNVNPINGNAIRNSNKTNTKGDFIELKKHLSDSSNLIKDSTIDQFIGSTSSSEFPIIVSTAKIENRPSESLIHKGNFNPISTTKNASSNKIVDNMNKAKSTVINTYQYSKMVETSKSSDEILPTALLKKSKIFTYLPENHSTSLTSNTSKHVTQSLKKTTRLLESKAKNLVKETDEKKKFQLSKLNKQLLEKIEQLKSLLNLKYMNS